MKELQELLQLTHRITYTSEMCARVLELYIRDSKESQGNAVLCQQMHRR